LSQQELPLEALEQRRAQSSSVVQAFELQLSAGVDESGLDVVVALGLGAASVVVVVPASVSSSTGSSDEAHAAMASAPANAAKGARERAKREELRDFTVP
jgi:hypothetical protein